MSDSITLRSSVHANVLRYYLFRGTFIAGLGALLIVYTGSIIPVEQMTRWGWIYLTVGGLLMVAGMIPYRNIVKAQNEPCELVVTQDTFTLYEKGKKLWSVPFGAVERFDYHDKPRKYGIGVILKEAPDDKVCVHDNQFDFTTYYCRMRERYGCDLFLPFFSSISFDEIQSILDSQALDE